MTVPATPLEQALQLEEAGRLARRDGALDQAEACWRQAIRLAPEQAVGAWGGLAMLCHEDGRLDAAENAYRAAIALRPAAGSLWHNLGALLKRQARPAAALAAYRRALDLQGDYAEGFYNIGNLYDQSGDPLAAEQAYRRALALQADYPEAHYNLGIALRAQGRLDEAEAAYRQAIALRAGYAEARNNLGMVLQARDGHAGGAAERAYRAAIEHAPRYPEAHNNLGVVLQERHDFAGAAAEFRTALACRPDYADARWNLALMHLIQGDFAAAWPDFGARIDITRRQTVPPPLPFPEWQGESLRGKRILIWPEQGHGDALQFCRYAPLLKAAGAAAVMVACKPPLRRLFSSLEGVDVCVAVEDGEVHVPNADYWAFIMSLPQRLGTTIDTIPAQQPYLRAPAEECQRFAQWLAPLAGRRVGLVWQGSGEHPNDRNRSLSDPALLKPLLALPGIDWVSLQLGLPDGLPSGLAMHDAAPLLHDFAASAALINALDLVLTVDTAVAHLAGALGKPVWVMLPWYGLDWRWLEARADSPWYPSGMRLFRQSAEGGWQPVLVDIEAALWQWLDQGASS